MFETLINLIFATIALLFPQPEPAPVTLAPAQVIERPVSTIGGTPVPYGLKCVEDHVIYFTGIDTLDCVHIDNL